ncbi:MAG: tRNA lysidine(34) synthetase TilS [Lacibacter sp.]
MEQTDTEFVQQFRRQLQQLGIRPGDRLLLAVSGGMDSTVLAQLCHQAQLSFRILHCNFQLRGAESDRDADFVRQFAAALQAPFSIAHFDTRSYAAANGLSIQEAARQLRYRWFDEQVQEELRQQPQGFDCHRIHVLTAHHADDNAETLLHHFFRGTGLRGLTGIPPAQGPVKRPLLTFSRAQLEQYARRQQLRWVEDASNAETYYTRNFLRHRVIPLLQQAYPQLPLNLQDNIRRFSETAALYAAAVENFKKKFLFAKNNSWQIPIRPLLPYRHTALLYELLRDFGFTEKQLPDIWHLTEAASGRYVQAAKMQYRIIRHRHWLLISPVAGTTATHVVIDAGEQAVFFPLGRLTLQTHKKVPQQPVSDAFTAQLDARHIHYPLLLRRWKAGDYFYPLGLGKKKKIARFLIDLKLSLPQKEAVWVLESAGRILWVVGYRIDDRFKIQPSTKEVLELKLRTE